MNTRLKVVALVIAVLSVVVLWMANSENASRRHKTAVANAAAQEARLDLARARHVDVDAVKEEIRELRVAMPRTPDLPGAIGDIGTALARGGLALDSVAPATEPDAGGHALTVTARGPVEALAPTLRELADAPRMIIVDGLEIRSQGPKEEAAAITLTLRVFSSGA